MDARRSEPLSIELLLQKQKEEKDSAKVYFLFNKQTVI